MNKRISLTLEDKASEKSLAELSATESKPETHNPITVNIQDAVQRFMKGELSLAASTLRGLEGFSGV